MEEPAEINPIRLESPATDKVEEIVEEAWEINPLPIVNWPVVEALAKLVFPETVREPKVPTLVSEDPVTAEPKAVADKVFAPLIAKKFPVMRFREPETYKEVVVALVVVDILIRRFWDVEEANQRAEVVEKFPSPVAVIVPHKRFPLLSVVRAEEPEQEVCNNCKEPPVNIMPLAKVEEAVVPEVRIRSALIVEEARTAPEI